MSTTAFLTIIITNIAFPKPDIWSRLIASNILQKDYHDTMIGNQTTACLFVLHSLRIPAMKQIVTTDTAALFTASTACFHLADNMNVVS